MPHIELKGMDRCSTCNRTDINIVYCRACSDWWCSECQSAEGQCPYCGMPSLPAGLRAGLWWGLRADVRFSRRFCIGMRSGLYCIKNKSCHPLETVLVGIKAKGDELEQIAGLIGVEVGWVVGFCDGLQQVPVPDTASLAYREGYAIAVSAEMTKWLA
jgi:hypothetical protein